MPDFGWRMCAISLLLLVQGTLAAPSSWTNYFFSSDEVKQPWTQSFTTVDADGDSYLDVEDLEFVLREHFRLTETDTENYEMILANEKIFQHQAQEVTDFFTKHGS